MPTLPQCQPDQELPISLGYWLENHWHSLLCEITDWTEKSRLTSCLRNKKLLLLGDSTTRQWLVGIHDLLGIPIKFVPGATFYLFQKHYAATNISISFSFHPQPLIGPTVAIKDLFYEVDMLDGLNNTRCNYIVLVSPWAHFAQWTRESYIERTEHLREALIRVRKRCPDVKIVLKGPHPRDHKSFVSFTYSNDFLLKDIGDINRSILRGIGIWFLPVWDMNLAYPVENTMHMPMTVIHEELKMFFGYICNEI